MLAYVHAVLGLTVLWSVPSSFPCLFLHAMISLRVKNCVLRVGVHIPGQSVNPNLFVAHVAHVTTTPYYTMLKNHLSLFPFQVVVLHHQTTHLYYLTLYHVPLLYPQLPQPVKFC
uniref:Uncharacterized protein n=1 Tax=Cacopsylla melanoneura TaxID=428564 RepID=A0A8D8S3H2_9HEMI